MPIYTNKIIIVDFGSQTAHLIGRRVKDFGVAAEFLDPNKVFKEAKQNMPAGIILSGGPASVYEKSAPKIDKRIFNLGIPILGICYGWQLTAHLLGGIVKAGNKEYGPSILRVKDFSDLFYGLGGEFRVFESHGDTVYKSPPGFVALASTDDVALAAARHKHKQIYGIQFHPEMHHTKCGTTILKNFITRICQLNIKPKAIQVTSLIKEIRERVGDRRVIGAISGGTDSAVAGIMVAQAIGKRFFPVYVESGLMRRETLVRIQRDFPVLFGRRVKVIHAEQKFLKALKGKVDPEVKRKIIGRLYIKLFKEEIKKQKDIEFLLQGTTYADFIHSCGSKRSAHIKSHHNVGGLPKKMKLKLLEPLKYFYTDEVRKIGLKLGLPKKLVYQQPFPGPGHAVRIVGEVTPKRLKQQIQADQIVVEEIQQAGKYNKVFQCFSIMTGAYSTAIKGDKRFYGEVVAVRVYNSKDRMTVDWTRLPSIVLSKISTRIVNEVPGISRVVYDITSKPPGTMEWE